MAIADIWRLAFQGTWQSQEYVNVFHIKFLSVGATPAGAVSYLQTNLWDLYKTQCNNQWNISSVHGVQLAVNPPVYDATLSITGSSAAEPNVTQLALVCSLRTGFAGRSKRGRLYLGGITEGGSDSGLVLTTLRNSVQTYFDDLVAGIGLGGSSTDYQWGVWSKVLGQPAPPAFNLAAGWTPISEVVVRNVFGTQRRRRLGVGA